MTGFLLAQLIDIEETELDAVRRCVVPFTGSDERRPDGAVGLHCPDGRRWWIASSYGWLVGLQGGPTDVMPAVRVPARVLRANLHGSLHLYVPGRTDDGLYRQPAALRFGRLQVEVWPEVEEAVDWRSGSATWSASRRVRSG
jgi:hypothetical protein